MATGKPLVVGSAAGSLLDEGGTRVPENGSYEAVLEAWRTAMTNNLTRAAAVANSAAENNSSQQDGKMEVSGEMPLMDNMQVAFVGRPSNTTPATIAAVSSPYLPNAVYVGGEYFFFPELLVRNFRNMLEQRSQKNVFFSILK